MNNALIAGGVLMPPYVNTPMLSSQRFVVAVLKYLGVRLKAEDLALAG
ncbi:hypothetical protein [Pseudomonas paeninsulae]|nr:hypothetical protein [Pseudomonas sp. IT1137]